MFRKVPNSVDALPPLAERPKYSSERMKQYFEHIGLPASDHVYNIATLPDDQKLDYLSTVLRYSLVAIPFENLSLHYSVTSRMLLSPALLFAKVVQGRCDDGSVVPGNRRGGYCMQNNLLFGTVLRSLGFDVVSAGARVNGGGTSGGWNHMNNIVHIADNRYMVDIGFGPNGPTVPLPLEHGYTVAHLHPAEQRIRYTRLAEHTRPESRIWVYEHRVSPDRSWEQIYCFTGEVEFLPADYTVMNFTTSNRRDTFFSYELVCTRFTMATEDAKDGSVKKGELDGCLILGAGLKKRTLGHNDYIVDKFANEGERLQALKDWFHIELPEEDRNAIKGLVSEIRS